MCRKLVIGSVGFFLGVFMLFNGAVCLYRVKHGYPMITSSEWLTSAIVTLLVGCVLVVWTALLIKTRK
ncbi:MAG: hypothetical protein KAR79_00880 [Simkaniaceae bacterium]|nr:hypothetical protein [Simkaniaceae bacterium]